MRPYKSVFCFAASALSRIMLLIMFVLLLLSSIISSAQKPGSEDDEKEERKGWYFGGNMGTFLANKHTANYYNSSDSSGSKSRISNIFLYPLNYDRIKQALGGYDFELWELPASMRYSPAAYIGLHARYLFTNNDAFLIQANYSKVKAGDIFTLKLQQPNYSSPEDNLYQANIWGVEERVNIDLGYSRAIPLGHNIFLGLEGGTNFNSVKVKESKVEIAGLQFSISDPYYSYYNVVEGGVNIGAFATANIQLWLNESLSLDPSLTCYYSKINLGENKAYKPQFALFVRLIYRN